MILHLSFNNLLQNKVLLNFFLDMNDNLSVHTENENKKTVLCVGMCVLDIVLVCNEFPVEDQDKR